MYVNLYLVTFRIYALGRLSPWATWTTESQRMTQRQTAVRMAWRHVDVPIIVVKYAPLTHHSPSRTVLCRFLFWRQPSWATLVTGLIVSAVATDWRFFFPRRFKRRAWEIRIGAIASAALIHCQKNLRNNSAMAPATASSGTSVPSPLGASTK